LLKRRDPAGRFRIIFGENAYNPNASYALVLLCVRCKGN